MLKQALIKTIVNRPGSVLLAFFGLFVVCVLMTGLIKFEQNIFEALPRKNPVFKVLIHALETSTAQGKLFFLVKKRDQPEKLIDAGKSLIRDLSVIRLDGKPAFKSVSFQKSGAFTSEDFYDLITLFLKRPEFFLTQDDVPRLSELLSSPNSLEDRIKHSLALLATPGAHEFSRIVALDPLNLREFLIERLQSMQQGLTFAPGPELLSPDGQALLIVALPAHPAGNQQADRLLMNKINQIRKSRPDVDIGVSGGYAIAVQEQALVRGDILGCLAGSVIAIGLLFFFIYRSAVALGFVLLPLVVGLQLALGVMALICNRIYLLATAFATVVLGLGIDFAVHVYDRFALERQAGRSIETAVEKAVMDTGSAVLAGCLTTVTAFLVLILTDSPVLRQIGWLVSLGLLFCLVTILLALPACLVWLEKRFNGSARHAMRPLGTNRLGSQVSKHPRLFLIISFLIILLAFPGVLRLRFEKNLSALRPQGLEALEVQEDLLASFGSGSQYVMAAWDARDAETFRKKRGAVNRTLKTLKESGIVQSWSSPGPISYAALTVKGLDLGAIEGLFRKYGLSLQQFRETRMFLKAVIGPGRTAQTENQSSAKDRIAPCAYVNALPEMFKRFFICDNGLVTGIAWIMVLEQANALTVRDELNKSCKGLRVVNPALAMDALVTEVRTELMITLGTAGLLIIGILMLFFRRVSVLPLVLLPVIMGLCVTAGIMGWAGINLNPFNFIVLPILFGIGLDDGIHIYRRYQEIGDIGKTLATTGRSVLVTTLTTICGFGSLSLADYHVFKSMGIMAGVGVLACFIFSVITLPAILALRSSNK